MERDHKANVLLVDDRPENLVALEAMLADLDGDLVKAGSGQEALRQCLSQEFAVILLDVQMPIMDGFETAELIRKREKSYNTPIIFLTAMSKDETNVYRGYSLGAVDYIFKPIVADILKAKVSVFVDLFLRTEEVGRQAELLHKQEEEERKLAHELAQARAAQEQLERELRSLEELPGSQRTEVAARLYGNAPLRESASEAFGEMAERYSHLLELALEQRTHKVEHGVSGQLRAVAEELGFLNAGPRDAVEIHSKAIKAKVAGLPAGKARAYLEEGRLAVLELMGYLVSFYRSYYPGAKRASSPGAAAAGTGEKEDGGET